MLRLALVLALSLALGCTPKRDGLDPLAEMPEAFSSTGEAPLPDRWWRALNDPDLNRLVDQALHDNFTVKIAGARMQAANAITRRERGGLFPAVNAFADGSLGTDEPFGGLQRVPVQYGLAARYEVDLWGRIRSGVKAENRRADAARADYQAAAMGVSAEVARTWVALAAARLVRDLIAAQLDANQQIAQLLEARFRSGSVRQSDVTRQQRLVEQTRAEWRSAATALPLLEHRLSVLLGRAPQHTVDFAPSALPVLPPLPETGLPLELVRRRPDVRSAFHGVEAADADVAVAITNTFPRLDLRASLASAPQSAQSLFQGWVGSLAAGLTAPLFAAGERRAEVRRSRAVRDQRLYEYGSAVLNAFQEVEDALIRDRDQEERISSLELQTRLSAESTELLLAQYAAGTVPYIDVLVAQTTEQRLGRDLISARQTHLEVRIGLYRALAGGFEVETEASDEP